MQTVPYSHLMTASLFSLSPGGNGINGDHATHVFFSLPTAKNIDKTVSLSSSAHGPLFVKINNGTLSIFIHFLVLAAGKLGTDNEELGYTRTENDDDDNEGDEGESGAAQELALDDPNHPRAVEPRPVRITNWSIRCRSTHNDCARSDLVTKRKIWIDKIDITERLIVSQYNCAFFTG